MITWNVPNTVANTFLTPVAISMAAAFFNYRGVSISSENWVIFTISYLWCSWLFTPDLDHEENPVGKYTFPFPWKTRGIIREFFHAIFKLLKPLGIYDFFEIFKKLVFTPFDVLRFIWMAYWKPYGLLLTHRGSSHLPIIGAFFRFVYLILPSYFLYSFFFQGKILSYRDLEVMGEWFIPAYGKGSLLIDVILTSVYISDILHSAVDLAESIVKGNKFCSKMNKSGLLAKIFLRRK